MKKLLIVFFVVVVTPGIACINEYRTLLNGQVIETDARSGIPYYKELNRTRLLLELASLDSLYKIDKSIKTLSDYGVILIYLGRLSEAIELFRNIERQEPNLYATAANIGTAFELSGEIDSALYYIRKAITIDPDSHKGSEWIHIKVLEAKKNLLTNPDYLRHTSILGINFGTDGKPMDQKTDLHTLQDQLRFQLGERMTFSKSPDIIVGQLLFDLGNICALTTDVESALECYARSKEFGYTSDLLDKRIQTLKPMTFRATLANATTEAVNYRLLSVIAMIVGGVACVWSIRTIIRKRRQKRAGT